MHNFSLKNLVLVMAITVLLTACSSTATPTAQPANEVPQAATLPATAPTATKVQPEAAPSEAPAVEAMATEVLLPTEPPAAASSVSFSQDVLPILQANCDQCHGETRQRAGLMLNTYALVMKGGRGGTIVIPNNSDASELVKVIVSGEMPKDNEKLSDAEIQLIKDWISAGALDN